MRDEAPLLAKRRFPKVLLMGIIFLLFFLFITAGYLWQRSSRPKLVLPTSTASNEKLLTDYLTTAGLAFEVPFQVEEQTITASVSGLTVFFSSTKNLEVQVRSLQLLLPEVTMSKDKITVIDLRFAKAVMR